MINVRLEKNKTLQNHKNCFQKYRNCFNLAEEEVYFEESVHTHAFFHVPCISAWKDTRSHSIFITHKNEHNFLWSFSIMQCYPT